MSTTFTAQDIIDATSQDIRAQLAPSWGDSVILLDYVNRICLKILRKSQWTFLISGVKRFITETGQTDYWIGASGSNPTGSVDTALNLSDVGRIKVGSIFDRSNWTPIGQTAETPLLPSTSFQDASARPGRPKFWRLSADTPSILNIYPAPDNQNTYEPIPSTPNIETTVSGALAARTYFIKVTFVDSAGGESIPSTSAARQYIPANSLVKVKSPNPSFTKSSSGITYSKYNVYISTTEGSETKQSVTTIDIGTDWTEPGSGLIAGTALPTTSTLEPLRGYVIEFRYYKIRAQVTTADQVLQIPDDYKDVIVAGVNYFAFLFLKRSDEATLWKGLFEEGLQSIIADKKLFPQGPEYVSPDVAATSTGAYVNDATWARVYGR